MMNAVIKNLFNKVRQPLGCLGGLVLSILLLLIFLFPYDAFKWAGAPFLLVPNALGMVDRVEKEEAHQFALKPGELVKVSLTKPGPYYLFHSWYYEWKGGPDHTITGPDGSVKLIRVERMGRPYDTVRVFGVPEYQFQITTPGDYWLRLDDKDAALARNKYRLGIVPDKITGNESRLNRVYLIQIGLILAAALGYWWVRIFRPEIKKRWQRIDQGTRKRDAMDDFFDELKHGTH